MTLISRLLTLTFAMLVTVTSVHMAQARGHMASVAGQVIICTGQGTEILTLDVSGEPVEIAHSCPDRLLTFASTDSPASYRDPQPIHMQTLAQAAVLTMETPVIPTHPPARGPPHLV